MELKKAFPQTQEFGSSMREAAREVMDHLNIVLQEVLRVRNLMLFSLRGEGVN
jgi:hypothetical protein